MEIKREREGERRREGEREREGGRERGRERGGGEGERSYHCLRGFFRILWSAIPGRL